MINPKQASKQASKILAAISLASTLGFSIQSPAMEADQADDHLAIEGWNTEYSELVPDSYFVIFKKPEQENRR